MKFCYMPALVGFVIALSAQASSSPPPEELITRASSGSSHQSSDLEDDHASADLGARRLPQDGCAVLSHDCQTCVGETHCRYCALKQLGKREFLMETKVRAGNASSSLSSRTAKVMGVCVDIYSTDWMDPIPVRTNQAEFEVLADCRMVFPDHNLGITCEDLANSEKYLRYRVDLEDLTSPILRLGEPHGSLLPFSTYLVCLTADKLRSDCSSDDYCAPAPAGSSPTKYTLDFLINRVEDGPPRWTPEEAVLVLYGLPILLTILGGALTGLIARYCGLANVFCFPCVCFWRAATACYRPPTASSIAATPRKGLGTTAASLESTAPGSFQLLSSGLSSDPQQQTCIPMTVDGGRVPDSFPPSCYYLERSILLEALKQAYNRQPSSP